MCTWIHSDVLVDIEPHARERMTMSRIIALIMFTYCHHHKFNSIFMLEINSLQICHSSATIFVPHSKSGIVPRSSLLGAGQLGFWEVGKGETIG
jgi:hypothetical protein